MPVPASSARRPSEKPTAATLALEYGSRWGTLTVPPIDAMFTIRLCGVGASAPEPPGRCKPCPNT